jgi:hypothetical protein
LRLVRRQREFFELVYFGTRAVADSDDSIDKRCSRQVDDAFAAVAVHIEAVITAGDYAADV